MIDPKFPLYSNGNISEILVAPVTDAGWTPLFINAAALVVDVGGLLSHGSVVAREYGLPAAVGVSGATKQIKTGERIKSPVIMANAWHHRSDALSSVAVFFGVAGARINPAWYVLDAYAALIVSLFILKVGLEILWHSIQELTDTAPPLEVLE